MDVIYENQIVGMGADVGSLGDEMIILFGEGAPDTLKDFCYLIEPKDVSGDIKSGQTLFIDDEPFEILAVGDVAQKNLVGLGHLTVSFTGDVSSMLPGAIVVEKKACPEIKEGTTIGIVG